MEPTTRWTRALLAGFILASGTFPLERAVAEPSPHPTSRFVTPRGDLPAAGLELHRPIEATVHGADVHRYAVTLASGQFASIRIRQVTGNLAAVVFDPDGKVVAIVDENGTGQPEVVTVTAAKPGRHVIQLAQFEWDAPDVRYAIELQRLEPAARGTAARARQLFASWYESNAPGAAVIVLKNGRVVFSDAIGSANLEHRTPITLATPFDLASVSKQFTAYAVAMLIERGELKPADDVRKFLPELPDYGSPITVRHLLEHKSGLRDWDGLFALTGRAIEDGIPATDVLQMAARQRALVFVPGAEQRYSNTNYVLLALIVERVTGQRFDAWMKSHVFEPLGMRSCDLAEQRRPASALDTYSYRGILPAPNVASRDPMLTIGSSALACSANDLKIWLANYGTGRLGGPGVRRLVTEEIRVAGTPPSDYVFGNWHAERDGVSWVGHQGLAAGYRTSIHTFPARGLSVIYLANDGNDATYPRVKKIEDLFLDIPDPAVEIPTDDYAPAATSAFSADTLASLVGTYASSELPATFRIEAADGRLVMRTTMGGVIHLVPQSGDAFGSDQWFVPQLVFRRGAGGSVTGFRVVSEDVGELPFERAD